MKCYSWEREVGLGQTNKKCYEAFVDRRGTINVAFFGWLNNLLSVQDPRHPTGYVDFHALGPHRIDIPTALAAAQSIDSAFNPATSVQALQFYGHGRWTVCLRGFSEI
jgi:hypothetical protein